MCWKSKGVFDMTTQPTRLEVRANMNEDTIATLRRLVMILEAGQAENGIDLARQATYADALRALLSASKPAAPDGIYEELKQRGLDEHLQRMREQEGGFKSEEDVKPHGWKGNPDVAPAALAQSAQPVAWMYESEDPLDGGEWLLTNTRPNRRNVRPLYTAPQPSPTAAVLDERAAQQDSVTREQITEWAKRAGFAPSQWSEKVFELFGDFAIFARAASPQPVEQTRALTVTQLNAIRYARSVMDSVSWATPDSIRAKQVLDALLTTARPASGEANPDIDKTL
jgi:hypothetical protein